MKKNILLLLFLFFSVINYGQRKEYKKAVKLFDAKNYSEATIIAEKILQDYPDDLDPNLKWYILNICADSNNFLKNYQKSIDYYTSLKKLATDGKVELTNKNEFLIDVDKVINELKNLIPVNNGTVINTSIEKQNNKINTIPTKSETDNNTVTLTVSGTGKTLEEAKLNALRSAIEQAFGAFISSKTEILNDNLIKDEIVSVASGNIQKFDIISETQLANIGFTTTLKATVSIAKLTSFVESKGVEVEFKGGLFASNILIQELYEKNETEAINNIIYFLKENSRRSFDYLINATDPISNNEKWNIPITVNVIANANFMNIPTLLEQTIKGLGLSSIELDNYAKLNKPIFPITIATNESNGIYYLRNEKSINNIIDFIYSLNNDIINFKISNGVDKFDLNKYNTSTWDRGDETLNLRIEDYNFRIILKIRNNGNGLCAASLFHNYCDSGHDSRKPEFNYKNLCKKLTSYNIPNYGYNFFSGESFKAFSFVENLLNNKNLGLVISFAAIKSNSPLVQFKFNEVRTIDEIKKITKYEIIKP
jgi:hypothetical protein